MWNVLEETSYSKCLWCSHSSLLATSDLSCRSGEWFQFTMLLVPASTETFNQGEREASGELERCFLNPPEVPTEQSSAVYSWHLGNTTSNGLVLPDPLSLLLCPVLWSHFPNKLLPLALGSFSASHAFRRALVKLLMKPISDYLFVGNAGDRGTRSLLTQGVSNVPRMDDWYFNQIECLKIKDRREGGKKDKGEEERKKEAFCRQRDLHDHWVFMWTLLNPYLSKPTIKKKLSWKQMVGIWIQYWVILRNLC